MLFTKRARRRAAAQRDALKTEIRTEVLDEVRRMLSLDRVRADGVPNLTDLNIAIRNIGLANMNLKSFGYEIARTLSAELPPAPSTGAAPVGLSCKASTQTDMESGWAAHWCRELHIPLLIHRKLWEFAYVLQAIYEHGHLRAGARGLGFGCGQEPIPSYLASQGAFITVTDLPAEAAQAAGWANTGQHAASLDQAFRGELVDRPTFDRLVDLRYVDMNAIPDDLREYDFCWSVCAFEHLGTLANGLNFVENSLRTIRPGGLSVHTTEFNIDPVGPTIDNWPSVLFQRQHFEEIAARLRAQGHDVAPLDFDFGSKPMDRFIDLPPWHYDLPRSFEDMLGPGSHLKVAIDGYPVTCFGLIVRKAA